MAAAAANQMANMAIIMNKNVARERWKEARRTGVERERYAVNRNSAVKLLVGQQLLNYVDWLATCLLEESSILHHFQLKLKSKAEREKKKSH